jgi:hypothetical protein
VIGNTLISTNVGGSSTSNEVGDKVEPASLKTSHESVQTNDGINFIPLQIEEANYSP